MTGKTGWRIVILVLLLATTACTTTMDEQAKVEPLEPNAFFRNEQSARPLLENTVPRADIVGSGDDTDRFALGAEGEETMAEFPLEITAELLERGRERFNIFCSPCHSYVGDGNGMIVQRGFPPPPTFHSERLRSAPDAHYYDVITNGFGVMYPYASRVPPQDRWAIIAYIRALQLSQGAPADLLSPEDREQLPAVEATPEESGE